MLTSSPGPPRNAWAAFAGGAIVGILGGLVGLGGAEFRLPLLIGVYRFAVLDAVILNKAMSVVVVGFALPFRGGAIPLADVSAQWMVIANLLAGSLIGAWMGATLAVRLRSAILYRIIAVLLAGIAVVLLLGHDDHGSGQALADGWLQIVLGLLAGFGIGAVASLMGVAGGELLIPALVILFGLDPKLAGSLSLAISLPTMLVGFARYARDRSFVVLGRHRVFVIAMAAGSIAGAFLGASLLPLVPVEALLPLLSLLLFASAVKLWAHR